MQPVEEGTICSALRAAVLLWVAAHVTAASTLPVQSEAAFPVWNPATEIKSVAEQTARAFAPAAPVETLKSTLFAGAAKPESPIELWLDARLYGVHLPARRQSDPLRGNQPLTWTLLGLATAILATVDSRHHRRRTHTGRRHAAETVGRKKKAAPAPLEQGRARLQCTCDFNAAHSLRAAGKPLSSPSRARDRQDHRPGPASSPEFQPPWLRW